MATRTRRDYYQVLGIQRDASADEIKRAYRRIAIQNHPDRNPGDARAEETFKEASEAYAVLSDADQRRRYDRMGHAAFDGGSGGFEQVDFSSVAEVFEGLLGEMFGSRRRRARTGRDVTYDLHISFEEAALGADKSVRITRPTRCGDCGATGSAAETRPEPCRACGGKGEVRYQRGLFPAARGCQTCNGTGRRVTSPCGTCQGQGFVERTEELTVRIPPGVEDGAVRTVRGSGEAAPGGAGDLHVTIRVAEHELFRREGADIHCTVPVSFPQAVLGSTLEVPTLDGKVQMKVPPGTQSGRVLRLRGKGIPVYGGYGKGDQLVHVTVEVPQRVSRRQRKLLEQLAEEMAVDTHPQQQSFADKLRSLFG